MNMSILSTCFRYHVSKQTPMIRAYQSLGPTYVELTPWFYLGKCLRYSSSDIISLRLIIVFLRANLVDFVDNRR